MCTTQQLAWNADTPQVGEWRVVFLYILLCLGYVYATFYHFSRS